MQFDQIVPLSYYPTSIFVETRNTYAIPKECTSSAEEILSRDTEPAASHSSRSRGASRGRMGRQDSTEYHRVERVQRSRSSPDRRSSSPRERARSPSTSILPTSISVQAAPAVLTPMIYNYSSNAAGAVAFYSPGPPAKPMYLISLQPYPVPLPNDAQVFHHSERQLITKKWMKKKSKKIVRGVVQAILRRVNDEIAASDLLPQPDVVTEPAIELEPNLDSLEKISPVRHSIASQTKPKSPFTRKSAVSDVDVLSMSSEGHSVESEETCEWAGDVRALRDSHVRLVLQQLRQLRDVERLRRTLRRAHSVSPHSSDGPDPASCVTQYSYSNNDQVPSAL